MKHLFRGYYKLTEKEIQTIWDNGFISFDTNVLLNFYRYSDDTRKELLRVIKKYSTQLWLTHHVGYEFHKNRVSVISDQIKIYDDTIKSFHELENKIVGNLKTPHLSKAVLKKFEKTIQEIIKDLESKKSFYKKLILNDTVLTKISTTFNKKVGVEFTSQEKNNIYKEGEERYKAKLPPGFKDSEKGENKFGDLVIWKELLRKAKDEKKPFILIIDDVKDDWWLRSQGQTISPRPELAQELFLESGQTFQLYTPDRFLEFASKTDKIKQEAIVETRDVTEGDSAFRMSLGSDIDLAKSIYDASLVGSNLTNFSEFIKNNYGAYTYPAVGIGDLINSKIKFPSAFNADILKSLSIGDELKNAMENINLFYSNDNILSKINNIQENYKAIVNAVGVNGILQANGGQRIDTRENVDEEENQGSKIDS